MWNGVYTSDPRSCALGPDVWIPWTTRPCSKCPPPGPRSLKDDAVEYARRLGVRIAAGSSSSGLIGTIVSSGNLNRDTLQAMGLP